MSWWYGHDDVDFDKDVNISVDVDYDSDVDIDFNKDVDIDIKVDVDVDIEGNYASITFDATAYGHDTLVEVDVVVLTIENQLSEVSGTIVSAVG